MIRGRLAERLIRACLPLPARHLLHSIQALTGASAVRVIELGLLHTAAEIQERQEQADQGDQEAEKWD